MRRIASFAAVALAATFLAAIPAAAATTPAAAATFCNIGGSKVTADWLKVRTTPGGSTVLGQLPHGARFEWVTCPTPVRVNGIVWISGYGYNGTHKLSGWVAERYLTGF